MSFANFHPNYPQVSWPFPANIYPTNSQEIFSNPSLPWPPMIHMFWGNLKLRKSLWLLSICMEIFSGDTAKEWKHICIYKTKVFPNKVCIMRLYTIKYCIFKFESIVNCSYISSQCSRAHNDGVKHKAWKETLRPNHQCIFMCNCVDIFITYVITLIDSCDYDIWNGK